MNKKTHSVQDKVSAAIQAYIDAYERRQFKAGPGDVFLSLPMKIKRILVREVTAEDLFNIYQTVIQKRRGLATVH